MIQSKLLKVKKWVDLNEAALRLSIALDEPVSAMDLLELALDGELVLSVKLPFDKRYVAKKIWEKHTPMGERLKDLFKFENYFKLGNLDENGDEYKERENEYLLRNYMNFLIREDNQLLPDEQKTYEFFCDSVKMVEWEYGDLNYLPESIYELSMLGSERIDVMWLIRQNKEMEMEELTNLNGVILRGADGLLYNLQDEFTDDEMKNFDANKSDDSESKKGHLFELDPRRYFPAGALPAGCELGMSPVNMSTFEAKLSECDTSLSDTQLLIVMGAVLNEITSTNAKRWTQGEIAARIGDKKLSNLGERTINGVFAKANKAFKSIG